MRQLLAVHLRYAKFIQRFKGDDARLGSSLREAQGHAECCVNE